MIFPDTPKMIDKVSTYAGFAGMAISIYVALMLILPTPGEGQAAFMKVAMLVLSLFISSLSFMVGKSTK